MPRARIVCLLLAIVTFLVYWPTRQHAFVNFDDPTYLTANPRVQSGLTWSGVQWAFTSSHAANWHPLTWLSHMLDWQCFGPRAGGHHLVSVFLHALNAVLLFLLLLRLTGALWPAALVAALFAWHPLRVESVAWVAERKDVLSAFFGLLSLLAYTRFARKPEVEGRKSEVVSRKSEVGSQRSGGARQKSDLRLPTSVHHPLLSGSYALALLCFALGLMAKPMLVTLPFVMLLLDYWPLQRLKSSTRWRLLLEKLPFFALSAASCIVTFIAQRQGESVAPLEQYPLEARLENVAVTYAKYLFQAVCPLNLAVIYPLPREIPAGQVLAALVFLAAISWWVWRGRRQRPYCLVGWLWFLGMLVPVIGLVQVGRQSMADRYTYLPMIGVSIGVVFGAAGWLANRRLKPAIPWAVSGAILAGCLLGTARQLRFWKDSETLFTRALAVTKDNYVALNNLGVVAMDRGRWAEGRDYFQQALAKRPYYPEAYYNLGMALLQMKQVDEAIDCFQRLLEIYPAMAAVHNNLGAALLQKGRLDEALVHFQQAVEIQADNVEAYNNLGGTLMQQGRVDEAIAHFEKAVTLRPQYAEAHHNLGVAFLRKGRADEAIARFKLALELQPDDAKARYNLATAFLQTGRASEAIDSFQRALEIQPDYVGVQNDLAWVLATFPEGSIRNGAKAVELAEQADRLSGGGNPAILGTLAAAYAEAGRFPDALAAAQRALQLASNQTNSPRIVSLKMQIESYEAGVAFRDASLTPRP